ncbi:unnamed protein product [Ilex paraguariensis]|uniref:Uncharacterized protein n=1 Tax=Ilex paraguariensis TaxID=185542 RepID=A0ABC8UV35_9AQUA
MNCNIVYQIKRVAAHRFHFPFNLLPPALRLCVSSQPRVCIAHQMSFDCHKKHQWFLWRAFYFMYRGRLWCSRRVLFRHWT